MFLLRLKFILCDVKLETYFIDTECISLVKVFNPVKAEKKLFDLHLKMNPKEQQKL